jgi:hypothetical protein
MMHHGSGRTAQQRHEVDPSESGPTRPSFEAPAQEEQHQHIERYVTKVGVQKSIRDDAIDIALSVDQSAQ